MLQCMVSNPQSLDHTVALLRKRAVNWRGKPILSVWKELLLTYCLVVYSSQRDCTTITIFFSAYIKRNGVP